MTQNPYIFPQKPPVERNKTHNLTARAFDGFETVCIKLPWGCLGCTNPHPGTENLNKCPGLAIQRPQKVLVSQRKTLVSLSRKVSHLPFTTPASQNCHLILNYNTSMLSHLGGWIKVRHLKQQTTLIRGKIV